MRAGKRMIDAEDGESFDVIRRDKTLDKELKEFDVSLVKKKKKKKSKKALPKDDTSQGTGKDHPWNSTGHDYTYADLLDRVFRTIKEKNPALIERKQHRLPPPELLRVGSKKSMWANFPQTCMLLNRNIEHVMAFFMTELATEGSIDISKRLIMRGRFQQKQIESLIKRYTAEYVTCSICKSADTTLSRDPVTRLYFVSCSTCESKRSVAPIRSGFHATSRADRRAARS